MIDTRIPFEIKEVGEDGTFKGIASVYGIEDLGGDVIDKGAFTKTVQENPVVPILWQHDAKEVIGSGEVSEWQGKLMLKGQLDLDDPIGKKAFGKMKGKLIKGLSIGFQTIKHSWEENAGRSIRHISELKLWEVSVVTFPMLPQAQITSVKSLEAEVHRLQEQVQALTAAKTTEESAGTGASAAISTPEPVVDHSRAIDLLTEIRSLVA